MSNPHAEAFLSAFAGIDTVYDFRAMHDRQRDIPAIPLRGTFAAVASELERLNSQGYGIHVMINETDGVGRTVANVIAIRAQLLDLDGVDAGQQMQAVCSGPTPPHIIVNTSPGKVQLWWKVNRHADKQLYTDNQKRLIGAYNGDSQFIDVAHTARLPGFYHNKNAATLVTVAAGPLWGGRSYDPWEIAAPLLHIPLLGSSASDRQPLGYPAWAALSLDWIAYALSRIDPNSLRRDEWIAVTAAVKQSGWSFGPDAVRAIWDAWCARYSANNGGENAKQWNDITATSSGWNALVKRANIGGDILAASMANNLVASAAMPQNNAQTVSDMRQAAQPLSVPQPVGNVAAVADATGPFLTPYEQASYFGNCFWVASVGRILTPNGRLADANKFNGTYGGKMFMLDSSGTRTTDEPWKACLRGIEFAIPKVDHMRFLPMMPYGAVVTDEFGASGVNTYRKPRKIPHAGDVSPFLEHVRRLFPVEADRAVLFAFMAQCAQRPGIKVGWSVLVQSMEGAGKTIFRTILEAALGQSYVYGPNARELAEGGGKFNGWMRNRLMIVCDEIRTDERRELIEVLKPWITDYRIEMQNKGQDQEMADNPTNWLMFTNYKDAIPINDRSRRFAILYSGIQTPLDMVTAGMVGNYFSDLYKWLNSGGAEAVAAWLLAYDIPDVLDASRGCTRAPTTSSTAEAVNASRGWLEQLILEAVENQRQGFRNGWVSSVAVTRLLKETGHRLPGPRVVPAALNELGYHLIGKSSKIYAQEFEPYQSRLYNLSHNCDIKNYGKDQGYEP